MTDSEIVKALECCDGSFDRCGECPLDNVNQDKLRCWKLEKSALDLINRLQAEKEELQELVNEMSDYFPACIGCEGKTEDGVRTDKCVFLIDKTNYCVKRGISNIVAIRKENAELKAENERLKETTKNMSAYVKGNNWGLVSFVEFCKNLKAEAYKECIEKVKEKAEKEELVYSGALVATNYKITGLTLNNLLKGLVGDE